VFISAGASVPGVFWNTIRTPSIVISSIGWSITLAGGNIPVSPLATPLPIEAST